MKNSLLLSVFVLGIGACIQPQDYPIEPEIEFVRVSKSELYQDLDTFHITFAYTDGDGDIGLDLSDSQNNVTITDSRTGFQEFFKVPLVPQQGANNGISGEISLLVSASCCLNSSPICAPTPNANPEEMTYNIQMYDKAGNESNVITTSPIYLICD